jgi:hypothetical protein
MLEISCLNSDLRPHFTSEAIKFHSSISCSCSCGDWRKTQLVLEFPVCFGYFTVSLYNWAVLFKLYPLYFICVEDRNIPQPSNDKICSWAGTKSHDCNPSYLEAEIRKITVLWQHR